MNQWNSLKEIVITEAKEGGSAGEFEVKPYTNLYYKETFEDESMFALDGEAKYTLEDNMLIFDDTEKALGSTVWLKKEMPKNYTVRYKARTVVPELAGNINMFMSAKTLDRKAPYEMDFGGKYAEYHKHCDMYILTLTGDFDFETSSNVGYTRSRRDPGFQLLSENKNIKTLHNHEHSIEVTKRDGTIQIIIDGKLAHLFTDENYIDRNGYFAFRTWKTKVLFYDFEVCSE